MQTAVLRRRGETEGARRGRFSIPFLSGAAQDHQRSGAGRVSAWLQAARCNVGKSRQDAAVSSKRTGCSSRVRILSTSPDEKGVDRVAAAEVIRLQQLPDVIVRDLLNEAFGSRTRRNSNAVRTIVGTAIVNCRSLPRP